MNENEPRIEDGTQKLKKASDFLYGVLMAATEPPYPELSHEPKQFWVAINQDPIFTQLQEFVSRSDADYLARINAERVDENESPIEPVNLGEAKKIIEQVIQLIDDNADDSVFQEQRQRWQDELDALNRE